jgi:hypothetical protein
VALIRIVKLLSNSNNALRATLSLHVSVDFMGARQNNANPSKDAIIHLSTLIPRTCLHAAATELVHRSKRARLKALIIIPVQHFDSAAAAVLDVIWWLVGWLVGCMDGSLDGRLLSLYPI